MSDNNWKLLATVAIIGVCGYGAIACSSSPPPPIVSHGTIQVSIDEGQNISDPGSATDPFENGAVIQVINPKGQTLAAAPINVGTGSTTEGSTALVNYVFTVTVPSGQSSYGLRVPGVQGITWETAAEMKAPALQVTVGS